jgi:hypothetical protein
LPNLEKVCYDLIETFRVHNFPFKALQFLEVLKKCTCQKKK